MTHAMEFPGVWLRIADEPRAMGLDVEFDHKGTLRRQLVAKVDFSEGKPVLKVPSRGVQIVGDIGEGELVLETPKTK